MADGKVPGKPTRRTKRGNLGGCTRTQDDARRGTPELEQGQCSGGLPPSAKSGDGGGPGSNLEHIQPLLDWLPRIQDSYDIRVVNDAGCGRQLFMKYLLWDVDYRAYDIHIYDNPEVVYLDITKEPMRRADLIICKDVFRHLDDTERRKALALFDARYALFDTEPGAPLERARNKPIDMAHYLGKPVEDLVQSPEVGCGDKYDWWVGKYWGIWKL